MAIKQTLEDSKSRLDALLTYANGVTGAEDTNIGDAIKTLCDGYGRGGSGGELVQTTYTFDTDTSCNGFAHPLFIGAKLVIIHTNAPPRLPSVGSRPLRSVTLFDEYLQLQSSNAAGTAWININAIITNAPTGCFLDASSGTLVLPNYSGYSFLSGITYNFFVFK